MSAAAIDAVHVALDAHVERLVREHEPALRALCSFPDFSHDLDAMALTVILAHALEGITTRSSPEDALELARAIVVGGEALCEQELN